MPEETNRPPSILCERASRSSEFWNANRRSPTASASAASASQKQPLYEVGHTVQIQQQKTIMNTTSLERF